MSAAVPVDAVAGAAGQKSRTSEPGQPLEMVCVLECGGSGNQTRASTMLTIQLTKESRLQEPRK